MGEVKLMCLSRLERQRLVQIRNRRFVLLHAVARHAPHTEVLGRRAASLHGHGEKHVGLRIRLLIEEHITKFVETIASLRIERNCFFQILLSLGVSLQLAKSLTAPTRQILRDEVLASPIGVSETAENPGSPKSFQRLTLRFRRGLV